jgi:hypothetical protein
MSDILNKYKKILKVELEDLEMDIRALVGLYEKRRTERKITNYVFLENISLIQHEVSCLKMFLLDLNGVDLTRFKDLQEMVGEIKERFRKRSRECSFPDAVCNMVERKIEKASRYVMES